MPPWVKRKSLHGKIQVLCWAQIFGFFFACKPRKFPSRPLLPLQSVCGVPRALGFMQGGFLTLRGIFKVGPGSGKADAPQGINKVVVAAVDLGGFTYCEYFMAQQQITTHTCFICTGAYPPANA